MNLSADLKKEMLGVALIGVFLFFFVSLLSYHPLDPSFHTVTDAAAKNLCGKAGSYLSDLFIQLFGLMSYLLVGYSWSLGSSTRQKEGSPEHHRLLVGARSLLSLSTGTLLQVFAGKVSLRGIEVEFSGFMGRFWKRRSLNFRQLRLSRCRNPPSHLRLPHHSGADTGGDRRPHSEAKEGGTPS